MTEIHEVTLKPSDNEGHKVKAYLSSLPSQSHTLLDFSKVAIGFVSLIMGFSIAFLGQNVDDFAQKFLVATWALLIVTAIASCVTIACVANDSITDRLSRLGTLFSNLSFFALVGSLIAFSLFGYFNMMGPKPPSLMILAKELTSLGEGGSNHISQISMSDGKVSFSLQMPDQEYTVSIERAK